MNTMVFLEDTLNQLQSFSTDEKQWLAEIKQDFLLMTVKTSTTFE